jgi:hypothetical protein
MEVLTSPFANLSLTVLRYLEWKFGLCGVNDALHWGFHGRFCGGVRDWRQRNQRQRPHDDRALHGL